MSMDTDTRHDGGNITEDGPNTIIEIVDYLDGFGLVVTDEDEIASALHRIGLAPFDKLALRG